jgi:hypothetical protein
METAGRARMSRRAPATSSGEGSGAADTAAGVKKGVPSAAGVADAGAALSTGDTGPPRGVLRRLTESSVAST